MTKVEAERVIKQRDEYIRELRSKVAETETQGAAAVADMRRKMNDADEKLARMEKSLDDMKKERDEDAQKLVEEINRAGTADPQ